MTKETQHCDSVHVTDISNRDHIGIVIELHIVIFAIFC